MKVESASKQCHDYSNYKEAKKEKKNSYKVKQNKQQVQLGHRTKQPQWVVVYFHTGCLAPLLRPFIHVCTRGLLSHKQ